MITWEKKSYRRILDNMPDGVYLVDPDRKVRFWNRGAEILTGFTADEVTGKPFNDSVVRLEDGRGNALQQFEHPVALCFQINTPVRKNFFLKTKDKGLIHVEEKASPLYEKGKITGVVAAFREITDTIKEIAAQLKTDRKESLIPICGWCKKIRKGDDHWYDIETYFTDEGFGVFTHGICPLCAEKIFEKKIYLESYQNICKAISSSVSVDEVLKLIVANVVKVMNVKASLLRLLNKKTQQLELAAYHGLSEKYANKGPVDYDASIDDALAGKSVSVYDITEHKDSRYYREAQEEGIRSILSIPMRFRDDVIGVLRMYTTEPVNYTDEDLKFISAIAEQAAIAIVNARDFEKAVSVEKEYLRVFKEITKAVSSTLNVLEVLDMIVRKIPEVMGLKASSLRLLNKESNQLELATYHGLSEKYANKGPVDYDASIDDALAGKSVSVYDIAEHKDSRYYKEALEEGIRSILSIPIRFRGEVIGVLRIYTTEPVEYTDEDLKFISAIAEQAAIAIVNARDFEKAVSDEKEYLRAFEEITKAVSSTLNVHEVLDMIVRKIPQVMNLKAATVRLLDSTGTKLKLAASYGLSEKYLNKGPVDTEKNIIEALKENPVAIYDVTTDSRIQYQKEAAEEGLKSMLTLPVVARGKVLGVLRLLTDKHRKFSQQEIDFVASLAGQCGMAIENATMYERLKKDYDNIMTHMDGAVLDKEWGD
ncbi:MAG: GAF domain-containing protein [Nitrospirota bacterium]